jgi:SAM-dependent methyltransferase
MLNLPFPDEYFDFIFCYGVLQHTPDPDAAYAAILAKLKPGGKISIDYYLAMEALSPWSTPKYLWRPVTKRLPPRLLLYIIKTYMPLWLPIDTVLRRLPRIGNLLVAACPIPCWNYLNFGLTYQQRLQWAILDTFDALAPRYDLPKTRKQVRGLIHRPSHTFEEVFLGSNGVVANVIK